MKKLVAIPRHAVLSLLIFSFMGTTLKVERASADVHHQLVGVSAEDLGQSTLISINGSSVPTFNAYALEHPKRVVVDLANSKVSQKLVKQESKAVWGINSWAVSNVTAHSTTEGNNETTRVVVGLNRNSTYKIKLDGSTLKIKITSFEAPAKGNSIPAPTTRDIRAEKKLQKKLMESKAESERLRKQIDSYQAKAQKEKAQLSAKVERMLQKQSESEALLQTYATKETIALSKVKTLQAEVAKTTTSLTLRQKELASLKSTKQAVSANEKKRYAQKIASAQKALKEARALRMETEEKSKEANKTLRVAEARKAKAYSEHSKAKNTLAKSQNQMTKLKAKETKLLSKMRGTEAKISSMQEDLNGLKRQAAESKKVTRLELKKATLAKESRLQEERKTETAMANRKLEEKKAAAAERRLKELKEEKRIQESLAKTLTIETKKKNDVLSKALALETKQLAAAKAARAQEEAKALNAKVMLAQMTREHKKAERLAKDLKKQNRDMISAQRRVEAVRTKAIRAEENARKAAAKAGSHTSAQVIALEVKAQKLRSKQTQAEEKLKAMKIELATTKNSSLMHRKKNQEQMNELAEAKRLLASYKTKSVSEQALTESLVRKRMIAERSLRRAESKLASLSKNNVALTDVKDIEIVKRDNGQTVIIEMSHPVKPLIKKVKKNKYMMSFVGANVEKNLQKTLDARKLKGPIQSLSTYAASGNQKQVNVVVSTQDGVEPKLERSGKRYYWSFGNVVLADKSQKRKKLASIATSRFKSPQVAGYSVTTSPISQQTVSQLSKRRKSYSGKRIDLNYKDASIHDLMRLLAEVGGVNIVIPEDIKARVTIHLKRVPWDQALDVILSSKQLGYKKEGPKLLRIETQENLDKEIGQKIERAKQAALREAPKTEVFNLNYVSAMEIQKQVAPMVSARGQVQVEDRTNAVIITDLAANRKRIISLLRRLDIQTPQLQIEARIVEARTTYGREFGIQWGGNAGATRAGGNATGLLFPSNVRLAGGATDGETPDGGVASVPSDYAVNLPASVGTGAGGALGLSLGSVGGNFNLNLRLSAAEDTGDIRIISAPKISVANNVEANISSGVSIPISVTSAQGVQTQFVPADLALKVTPTVSLRDCAVSMNINVTKNEADFANTGARGDPSLIRKEATTSLLVNDGQTTVIGGIYTRNTSRSTKRVPFFSHIPILGHLFKSQAETDDRTEVLIFITPKITNREALPCQ